MSTIGSTSGISNSLYVQPASNRVQSAGRNAEGGSSAGLVSKGSNFMQAIEQALGQSLGSSVAPAATAATDVNAGTGQDPAAAVQAFMHGLLSALHQSGNNTGSATDADRDGDNDAGGESSDIGKGGSNMAAKIQNLLQQFSANNQSALTDNQSASAGIQGSATDPLSNLNSSFQDMINTLNPSQGSSAANANSPTLQSFLQNLMQNLSNGQNITGAVVSTKA